MFGPKVFPDHATLMPVIGERYLSVVSLTVGLFVASASTSQVIDRTEALTAETWNSLCIPFSQDAIASANLSQQEQSILPDLCYRPDLTPHIFGSEEDRGIPPGIDCTPIEWYMPSNKLNCFLLLPV